MAERLDRRQARTKQLLRKALLEIIAEKGVDGITVTDISNRADVNRGTFYLHYQDAPDMLRQIMNEIIMSLFALMQEMDPVVMRQYAVKDIPYPNLVRLLTEFANNADFLKVMLGPKGDPSFAQQIMTEFTSRISNRLAYWQPSDENMLIPRDYLIAYISSANFGVVKYWLETDIKLTPEEVTLILMRVSNLGPMSMTGLPNKNLIDTAKSSDVHGTP
ncbi:TetR family transcriptional regulator [Paenibacillus cellulosilyticus]|uniref:TetR family transcriptional regulator n=1 Tax=Paenibacillus cellulosilyticus TaxID=375489 RepID=A0A2V2YSC6_9BACL|nr:TetR/AcrR family transcriptional regulator [Paenibacillus cellulosilyticus]PWW00766.1 TetR family transcriptional regulator [Paenibacillus cellulosilyticus]QKS45621.1 TetR/AcrR family transcriptional regulator [Paenibacillus cellulosilyticus]